MLDENIPQEIVLFAKAVLEKECEVIDWDYRRVEVDVKGEEYSIRTWDVTQTCIRWTLFKTVWRGDGTGYGEEVKSGVYNF